MVGCNASYVGDQFSAMPATTAPKSPNALMSSAAVSTAARTTLVPLNLGTATAAHARIRNSAKCSVRRERGDRMEKLCSDLCHDCICNLTSCEFTSASNQGGGPNMAAETG